MDFILVPDALFASEARYALAQNNTVGTRVGSFQVLLETLAELWVLPQPTDTWAGTLQEKALTMQQAFWAQSIKADERATVQALTASLQTMLDYRLLGKPLAKLPQPDTRQQRYYNDLVQLQYEIEVLPLAQQIAEDWFDASSGAELQPLHLYPLFDISTLLPWQQGIIQCLQDKGWLAPQASKYSDILPTPQTTNDVIRAFSQRLFNTAENSLAEPGESLQWLTCRDAAQEAEATAAILQQAVRDGIKPQNLAIVVPKSTAHNQWLEYYLDLAGIQASNLRPTADLFDWQTALMQNLLSHLAQPSVRMAMQSVLINPLMPWSQAFGHVLADKYNSSGALSSNNEEMQAMLEALQGSNDQPVVITSAEQCMQWLQQVTGLLSYKGVIGLGNKRMNELLQHVQRLFSLYADQAFAQQLQSVLKQLTVGTLTLQAERQRYLNAVLVIEEGEALPSTVEQLYVLGFNAGHYQYTVADTGALTRYEWEALAAQISESICLPSLQEEQQRWQLEFVTLLGSAQQITFMRSLADAEGNLLDASDTLLDMALCYQAADQVKTAALECSLFSSKRVATAEHTEIKTVDIAVPDKLEMQGTLLGLYSNSDGSPRHESPSSLDSMMLSPLAWLLGRLRVESNVWEVASLQPSLAGTIAHQVLEDYAALQNQSLDEISVKALFENAVQKHAAFLNGAAFSMAKQDLCNSVIKALAALDEWRRQEGWSIDQVEVLLEGSDKFGITVKGKADAVLKKGDDILILDYKKSSHKERLKRLDKGYELQTALYRDMYKKTFGQSQGILSSGYYTLNDQVLIADLALQASQKMQVKNVDKSLGEQSVAAEAQVAEVLQQLRNGTLTLNSSDDIKTWQGRGVSVYALSENRLVQRFTTMSNSMEAAE